MSGRRASRGEEPEERLTGAERQPEDAGEHALRPQVLEDFAGQASLRENLAVFIAAAILLLAGAGR